MPPRSRPLFPPVPWQWVWVVLAANVVGALAGGATYLATSQLSHRHWIFVISGFIGLVAEGSFVGALANGAVEDARTRERLHAEIRNTRADS